MARTDDTYIKEGVTYAEHVRYEEDFVRSEYSGCSRPKCLFSFLSLHSPGPGCRMTPPRRRCLTRTRTEGRRRRQRGRETNWSMTVRKYLCHFPPLASASAFARPPDRPPFLPSVPRPSLISLPLSARRLSLSLWNGDRAAAISVRFISRSMRGVDRRGEEEWRGHGPWRERVDT